MTTPRVTVPVEPTEAMLDAAESVGMTLAGSDMSSPDMTRHIWAAMLSAAPAPAPEGGAVDWQPIETALQNGTKVDLWGHWPEHDRWARTPDAVWDEERCDWKVNGFYAGQYAHPPRFTHWRAISGPAALATREEAPANTGECPCNLKADDCHPDCPHGREKPPAHAFVQSHSVTSEGGCKICGRDKEAHEAPAEAGENVNWKAEYEAVCEARISDRQKSQEVINERDKWIAELIQERDALRAQPPAREDAQPVAAMRVHLARDKNYGHLTIRHWVSIGRLTGGEHVLYTHPAPDALRVAVEAGGQKNRTVLQDELDRLSDQFVDLYGVTEKLREALDPFARIASEGVIRIDKGHVTVTTCAEYFHAAVKALAALQAEQKGGAS